MFTPGDQSSMSQTKCVDLMLLSNQVVKSHHFIGCGPIAHAVNAGETGLSEERTITCSDGYGRIGPSVMTCQVDGSWNETTPTECHQLSK